MRQQPPPTGYRNQVDTGIRAATLRIKNRNAELNRSFRKMRWGTLSTIIMGGGANRRFTQGYPCEQIHKSIIGVLPRKHAQSANDQVSAR